MDQEGEILDGHHRVQIAEKHGLKYETVIRDFASEDAKKEHVLKLNLLRRHLPPYEWGLAFKQLASIRTNGRLGGKGGRPGENEVTVSALAEVCGVSPRTARRRVMQAEDYLSLPVEAKQAVDVSRTTMAQAKRDREESSCQKKQKRCFLHEDKGTGPYDDDKYDVCETCADKIKELGLAKVQLRCTDNTCVLIDAAIDLK